MRSGDVGEVQETFDFSGKFPIHGTRLVPRLRQKGFEELFK